MFIVGHRCEILSRKESNAFLYMHIIHSLCLRYSFRKNIILSNVPNQHSNGLLDFESVTEADSGEYICRGQNRVGFSEENVIIELIDRGSPPSIDISPKSVDGRLQIPLHSYQTIECLNQDPTTSVDITWRRADTVRPIFFSCRPSKHNILE